MIEISKKHLATMMEAGYVYLGMRKYKEAREMFDGLSLLAPASEVPHVALGNVEFCMGKLDKAIACYREALKKDPKSVFAKVYMGEALLFSDKRGEGKTLLAEVAKADRTGAGDLARALLDALKEGFEFKPKAVGKRTKGSRH